jgi:hypothetical protein
MSAPPKPATPPATRPRRMTLDAIYTPKANAPFRVHLYGPEKIGKSTWAAAAPTPIFLSGDNGLGLVRTPDGNQVKQWTPESYGDIIEAIDTLTIDKHEFQTLVMDPMGWFEPMIWAEYIRLHPKTEKSETVKEINDYGFFKGQYGSVDIWRSLLARLELMQRARGMNVILVTHSQIKLISNPTGSDFERYCLQIDGGPKSERVAGVLAQWPDAILFVNYATVTRTIKGKTKGIGTGTRVVYTQPNDAFVAGNRYGLPDQLPLDFAEFYSHITGGQVEATVERLRAEALALVEGTEFEEAAKKSIEQAGSNTGHLLTIINRASMKLRQQQQAEETDDNG